MSSQTQSASKSYATVTSNTVFPKKDQAVVIESVEGVTLKEYIQSLSTLVNSATIRFISRISNSRVCIYFDSKQTADNLLEREIKIRDKSLQILPLITKNKRIVLSNVCPVIPHHIIENRLKEMNVAIKSPITFMKVGIAEPGFSHILSFRRQLYVAPEDIKLLPESFQISYDDTNYWIYVSTDALKCFTCNNMGHLAKYCPQNNIEYHLPSTSGTDLLLNNEFQTPITTSKDKGVKRLHSITTTDSPDLEHPPLTTKSKENYQYPVVEYDTDTSCSNFSSKSVEDKNGDKNKRKKKKAKTEDHRNEEEVWNDIKNELNDQILSPINLDQFISLLDKIRGKHNIKDTVTDYTYNIKDLILLCNTLHPKMNRSLKNRCSRLTKKLHEMYNLSALTPGWDAMSDTKVSDNINSD